MKDQYSNSESQEEVFLDKEFVAKIAKSIYSSYLYNEVKFNDHLNNIDVIDDAEEVGIQFSFFADEDEDGVFGIAIEEEEMYIDEYNSDHWDDATDFYDTFDIKVQIENEVAKLASKKPSHKKNKEVIKHMKSDI